MTQLTANQVHLTEKMTLQESTHLAMQEMQWTWRQMEARVPGRGVGRAAAQQQDTDCLLLQTCRARWVLREALGKSPCGTGGCDRSRGMETGRERERGRAMKTQRERPMVKEA